MPVRRLVVVAVATSALVLAGGMAATTAGAQMTPDVPPGVGEPAGEPATGVPAAGRRVVSDSAYAPVQQLTLALINQDRRRGGCPLLSLDERLNAAANQHAADMARRGYFAHDSPNGDGPGDRVRRAGYAWQRYGENIAKGMGTAYEVVDSWMRSPEHRANILDCRLDQMGLGLAVSRDRTAYWVQDFATPLS
jgi:uncharacterized protein YkwD